MGHHTRSIYISKNCNDLKIKSSFSKFINIIICISNYILLYYYHYTYLFQHLNHKISNLVYERYSTKLLKVLRVDIKAATRTVNKVTEYYLDHL